MGLVMPFHCPGLKQRRVARAYPTSMKVSTFGIFVAPKAFKTRSLRKLRSLGPLKNKKEQLIETMGKASDPQPLIQGKDETKSPSKRKRRSSGHKRKKKKSIDKPSQDDNEQPLRKKSRKRPLNGLVCSISTTSNNDSKTPESITYASVSNMTRELGAEVLGQMGKRVKFLICTHSAVQQASQRVRKAYKKKIPIVSVEWLEECYKRNERVDVLDYILDEEAKEAIDSRKERFIKEGEDNKTSDEFEIPPDAAGWSEAKSLGCCCVCHENGTEKDCPWCVDCC